MCELQGDNSCTPAINPSSCNSPHALARTLGRFAAAVHVTLVRLHAHVHNKSELPWSPWLTSISLDTATHPCTFALRRRWIAASGSRRMMRCHDVWPWRAWGATRPHRRHRRLPCTPPHRRRPHKRPRRLPPRSTPHPPLPLPPHRRRLHRRSSKPPLRLRRTPTSLMAPRRLPRRVVVTTLTQAASQATRRLAWDTRRRLPHHRSIISRRRTATISRSTARHHRRLPQGSTADSHTMAVRHPRHRMAMRLSSPVPLPLLAPTSQATTLAIKIFAGHKDGAPGHTITCVVATSWC